MAQIKDLDMLKDIGLIYNKEIILYGAGNYGRKAARLLRELEVPILGFCDSDEGKWETQMEGCKVFSLQDFIPMSKENRHIIIIITMADPGRVQQVLEILDKYEMTEMDCYTYFALQHTVELHIDDRRIKASYRKKAEVMKKVYGEWFERYRELVSVSTLWDALSAEQPLLILQPGKVGSKTVQDSLIKRNIACLHTHTLTGSWGNRTFTKNTEGLSLLNKAEKIKIISLVRDPIARGISLYFQCFREYIVTTYGDFFDPDTCKGVIALLEEELKRGAYGAMFEWFHTEMKEVFDIDVYQYPFDKEYGFQVIRKNNVELLLIKAEKLNECEEVIGRFVEKENFQLVQSNVGNDKLYRFAYQELKRMIRIPDHILDFYYKENSAMNHFYTREEREAFYKKWFR